MSEAFSEQEIIQIDSAAIVFFLFLRLSPEQTEQFFETLTDAQRERMLYLFERAAQLREQVLPSAAVFVTALELSGDQVLALGKIATPSQCDYLEKLMASIMKAN